MTKLIKGHLNTALDKPQDTKANLSLLLSKLNRKGMSPEKRLKLDQIIDLINDRDTKLPSDDKLAQEQATEFLKLLLRFIYNNKLSEALDENQPLLTAFLEKKGSEPKKTMKRRK